MFRGAAIRGARVALRTSTLGAPQPVPAPPVQETRRAKNARIHEVRRKDKGQSLVDKFRMNKEKRQARPEFEVWPSMSVRDLARVMGRAPEDVLDLVLTLPGAEALDSERQPINDPQLLMALAKKVGVRFRMVASPAARMIKSLEEAEEDKDVKVEPAKAEDLRPRPPVVAIMGHIDHGKTSLLDYLRESRIVEGEFGGITQHIGAFSVRLPGQKGRKVTFIDTPGHAAFKAMRSRGAQTTDMVVLVVDAAEGVKEQTMESLRMCREASTPIIVALNKIDRPGADVEGTKRQLKEEAGVDLEDYGGEVQAVPVSAKTGAGVSDLVEALAALAEVLQLSASRKGPVEGVVIESSVRHGLGKTATVLVKRGALRKGAHLVSQRCSARVKKVMDDRDREVKEALPSDAVTVAGWRELPPAGETVNEVPTEKRANEVVQWRTRQEQRRLEKEAAEEIDKLSEAHRQEYEEIRKQKLERGIRRGKVPYGWFDFHVRKKESGEDGDRGGKVPLVVKADVDGSLEAILNCLDTYDSEAEEVALDLMDFGVGEVTEGDVALAKTFGGIIYAFNTKVSPAVLKLATDSGVPVRGFNVIYHLVDDLKEEINSRLPLADEEEVTGKAEVLQEFMVSSSRSGNKKVPVAGCKVKSGRLERGDKVRVFKDTDDSVAYDGEVVGLRHHKNEVPRMEADKECGVLFRDEAVRFSPGDRIVTYRIKKVPQKTTWSPGF